MCPCVSQLSAHVYASSWYMCAMSVPHVSQLSAHMCPSSWHMCVPALYVCPHVSPPSAHVPHVSQPSTHISHACPSLPHMSPHPSSLHTYPMCVPVVHTHVPACPSPLHASPPSAHACPKCVQPSARACPHIPALCTHIPHVSVVHTRVPCVSSPSAHSCGLRHRPAHSGIPPSAAASGCCNAVKNLQPQEDNGSKNLRNGPGNSSGSPHHPQNRSVLPRFPSRHPPREERHREESRRRRAGGSTRPRLPAEGRLEIFKYFVVFLILPKSSEFGSAPLPQRGTSPYLPPPHPGEVTATLRTRVTGREAIPFSTFVAAGAYTTPRAGGLGGKNGENGKTHYFGPVFFCFLRREGVGSWRGGSPTPQPNLVLTRSEVFGGYICLGAGMEDLGVVFKCFAQN